MPPRLGWNADLWIGATVTGNQFFLFGRLGAFLETGALILAGLLAFATRGRRLAFFFSLAGAILLLVGFCAWWIFVFPVNVEMASWSAETAPPDWMEWRTQWEYGHAGRAVLLIAGYGALLASIVAETPAKNETTDED